MKLWQTAEGGDAFVEAYTVGDDPKLDERFLKYEVYGSAAHAAGLHGIGLLSDSDHSALKKSLAELLAAGRLEVLPEQEDIHTAVEARLTERAGEAGKRIHAGRSRNDQVQVNLRLFMKDALLSLHAGCCDAAEAWLSFARARQGIRIPGYTHLQRAMPTTLGHWAASHAEALLEGARSLRRAFEEADSCPLGSAAGYGAPLALDREKTAALLGFSRVQRNTLRVQTARPRVEAAVVAGAALVARDLGVLAWDLSLFTTREFGFFRLSPAFSTGSSLMPQKRNPDPVELTRAKAALFPGWVAQILSVGNLPSGYHRDYQATKGILVAALDSLALMLEAARRLPAELTVDEGACAAAVTRELLSTGRALERVKAGMAFRDAYRAVADEERAGAATAEPVEDAALPGYPGAPGDPGFDAIAAECAELARWSAAETERLHACWRALVSAAEAR